MTTRRLVFVLAWLTGNVLVGAVWAQEAPAPAVPAAETVDPLLVKPPTTAEDIAARQELARTRIETLRSATQPAAPPGDEGAAEALQATAALLAEWENYATQLQRLAELQAGSAALSSEQRINELAEQIQAIERQRGEVAARPLPLRPTEADVAEITALQKELEGRLSALSEEQARRAAQLASGFAERGEALTEQLRALRQTRQEQRGEVAAPAVAPPSATARDLRRRTLDVQIARLELTQQALVLEQSQTALLHKQDERKLEAQRQYADVLQQRGAALAAARSRGALETIQQQLDAAETKYERAFLEIQYLCESVLVHYFKSRELWDELTGRFPARELERLRERVTRSQALWRDLTTLIEYRAGRDVVAARREVRAERMAFQAELASVRRALGRVIATQHEIQTVRGGTLARFDQLSTELARAVSAVPAAEGTRLTTETANARAALIEAIRAVAAEATAIETRLREADELLKAHVELLHTAEDSLHWAGLGRRESGLAGADWRRAWLELRQLGGWADDAAAVPASPRLALAAAGVLAAPSDVRTDLGAALRKCGEELGRFGAGDWLRGAVLVLIGCGLGALLRVTARRRTAPAQAVAEPAEEAPERATSRSFGRRVELTFWHTLGDGAIPAGIFCGLWAAGWWAGWSASLRQPVLGLLGVLLAGFVLLRLVRWLFAARAEARLVACEDPVAGHYRYWGRALLIFSLVLLTAHVLLLTLGVAVGVQAALWELWKTGVLLMLARFLLRKPRVIGCVSPTGNWASALASSLYPLLLLAVLALLVLQLIGFGVLVEYVGIGALLTVAVLMGVAAGVEYLCYLLSRMARVSCAVEEGAPSGGGAAAPAASTLDSFAGEPTGADDLPAAGGQMLGLFKTLIRVAGTLLAVLLTINIWGGGALIKEFYSWNIIVGVGIIVVAALVVDRILLTAVRALQVSGRLPRSAANIIRRWSRGLLTAIVVLASISMAGFQVQALWAPLSALLAMVAVGFVAVWSLLSNVLATLMILAWRPFNVGERISIQPDGISGQVIDINFLYTLLRSEDGEHITVPNSLFMQKFTRRSRRGPVPKRTLAEQLEAEKPIDE
jgi:hypothetical protein